MTDQHPSPDALILNPDVSYSWLLGDGQVFETEPDVSDLEPFIEEGAASLGVSVQEFADLADEMHALAEVLVIVAGVTIGSPCDRCDAPRLTYEIVSETLGSEMYDDISRRLTDFVWDHPSYAKDFELMFNDDHLAAYAMEHGYSLAEFLEPLGPIHRRVEELELVGAFVEYQHGMPVVSLAACACSGEGGRG